MFHPRRIFCPLRPSKMGWVLVYSGSQVLGKPAMADMSLGLATAPILYAAENAPEIKKIVKRRFKKEVREGADLAGVFAFGGNGARVLVPVWALGSCWRWCWCCRVAALVRA